MKLKKGDFVQIVFPEYMDGDINDKFKNKIGIIYDINFERDNHYPYKLRLIGFVEEGLFGENDIRNRFSESELKKLTKDEALCELL